MDAYDLATQHWALEYLADGPKLCSRASVTVDSFGILEQQDIINVFTQEANQPVNLANADLVSTFKTTRFFLDSEVLKDKRVFLQKCNISTEQCSSMLPLNLDELAKQPAACL